MALDRVTEGKPQGLEAQDAILSVRMARLRLEVLAMNTDPPLITMGYFVPLERGCKEGIQTNPYP